LSGADGCSNAGMKRKGYMESQARARWSGGEDWWRTQCRWWAGTFGRGM